VRVRECERERVRVREEVRKRESVREPSRSFCGHLTTESERARVQQSKRESDRARERVRVRKRERKSGRERESEPIIGRIHAFVYCALLRVHLGLFFVCM